MIIDLYKKKKVRNYDLKNITPERSCNIQLGAIFFSEAANIIQPQTAEASYMIFGK